VDDGQGVVCVDTEDMERAVRVLPHLRAGKRGFERAGLDLACRVT
jgi:hypothetical protein